MFPIPKSYYAAVGSILKKHINQFASINWARIARHVRDEAGW